MKKSDIKNVINEFDEIWVYIWWYIINDKYWIVIWMKKKWEKIYVWYVLFKIENIDKNKIDNDNIEEYFLSKFEILKNKNEILAEFKYNFIRYREKVIN